MVKKKKVTRKQGKSSGVKKRVAAKTTAGGPAAKKATAKKTTATKATAKKTVARKKAASGKRPVAAAGKAVVKKTAARKAVSKKKAAAKPASPPRKVAGKGLGLTYITRMDHGNTHGWWVRVYKDSKPVESKLFSDGVHGGKLKAKKKAQAHRDAVVARHKIVPVHLRKTREHSVDKRSTSGVVGVTLSMAEKAGALRVHWSARFMDKGRQRNVSFSVRKYGYEGAFRRALRVRCEAIDRPVPRGIKPPAPNRTLERWMKKHDINPGVNRVKS